MKVIYNSNFGWIIERNNLYFAGNNKWIKLNKQVLGFKTKDFAENFKNNVN